VFNVRHALPSEIFRLFSAQVFDYFSFAIVRNPFERIASAWRFGRKMKLHGVYGLSESCSFEQFIDFLYEAWEAGRKDILILRNQT
ncbi:sulfotransferase family 2 domain-containing protein, partial [Streptomyces caeruleatus]